MTIDARKRRFYMCSYYNTQTQSWTCQLITWTILLSSSSERTVYSHRTPILVNYLSTQMDDVQQNDSLLILIINEMLSSSAYIPKKTAFFLCYISDLIAIFRRRFPIVAVIYFIYNTLRMFKCSSDFLKESMCYRFGYGLPYRWLVIDDKYKYRHKHRKPQKCNQITGWLLTIINHFLFCHLHLTCLESRFQIPIWMVIMCYEFHKIELMYKANQSTDAVNTHLFV